MRQVMSEAAEEAASRVMTTLAMGATATGWGTGDYGRLRGTPGVLLSDPRHSMVLPHIVAIAEEFARRSLILASLPLMDLGKPMHRDLWSGAALRAEGTWRGQSEAWLNWHRDHIDGFPGNSRFRAFVDARNAIMHGLGELTSMQTRKDGGKKVMARLKAVGITLNGIRLVIVPTVLAECAVSAREFIVWLDQEVNSRHLLPVY